MNKDQGEIEILKYGLLFWGQKYKVLFKDFYDAYLQNWKLESAALYKWKCLCLTSH